MSSKNAGIITCLSCAGVIALFCGVQLFTTATSRAQETPDPQARRTAPKGKLSKVPAQMLDWPLPANADKSYAAIDAHKLHGYVEELAVISRKYRDA